MLITPHFKTLLLSGFLLSPRVSADDEIKIKFSSGYPLADQSTQSNEIQISRIPNSYSRKPLDVDILFANIESLLRNHKAPIKWASLAVDSPYVELKIAIGKSHYSYAFTYSPTFTPEAPDLPDLDAKMTRLTLEILKLSKNHIAKFYDIK